MYGGVADPVWKLDVSKSAFDFCFGQEENLNAWSKYNALQ
mgnify:FL=1